MLGDYYRKLVPSPLFVGYNPADLNRNFPWSWAPGHEQIGAGPFPVREPEARGVVEFATAHPEIFAWCNYHTFGGVLISSGLVTNQTWTWDSTACWAQANPAGLPAARDDHATTYDVVRRRTVIFGYTPPNGRQCVDTT